MLKKIGKKLISVLLAVTLIATTFLVFDPSILVQKSKAAVDVKKLVNTVEPAINFYVPETIYLNPVIGSGGQPYSFQYFVDCDENGTLHRSATQTHGYCLFLVFNSLRLRFHRLGECNGQYLDRQADLTGSQADNSQRFNLCAKRQSQGYLHICCRRRYLSRICLYIYVLSRS